jgi:hypothetical protein
MIYLRKQLPELKFLKHRNDTQDWFVKYDDIILKNSLSPYIVRNRDMNEFILKLQPLVSLFIDSHNIIKNWRNYIVDKYDFRNNS